MIQVVTFDEVDYRRQQRRLCDELERRDLAGLLVLNPVHVFYLTGYQPHPPGIMERPVALFLRTEGQTLLMLSLDVARHNRNQPSDISESSLFNAVDRVETYAEYPFTNGVPTLEWIAARVESEGMGGKRVGVEHNYSSINDTVSRDWFGQIQDAFNGDVVPAGDLVSNLRVIKQPEEIAELRRASFWADELVREISERIEPGALEDQIAAEASDAVIQRMKAEHGSLVKSTANGQIILEGSANSFLPAGSDYEPGIIPSDQPIIVNCVVCFGGYHGESERTGIISRPTARQRELFDIAIECQRLALEAVRPGVRCGDVDAIAHEFITSHGFDYLYGVGHGIGLLGHEPPWLRPSSETLLEENMVVCVEPGLAILGEGSFHNSQTVLVTDSGAEPLTVYDGLHRLELP